MFKDKTLLITGGTGSFGNAVLRRFLNTGIKEIRIFSRDEKKQDDMRVLYKSDKIKYYIGDVREFGSINEAMIGVDYVFHAAALKQVPSCEFYPMEAVRKFMLKRNFWNYPALIAFHSRKLTHLFYFSMWAKVLHDIMYTFRKRPIS
jgi:UDP-glucose 4-epimerase